ncbi:response regulator [Pleurocapsales cyanobacterium LEGE 10410]|nr:response regulator [Pleurocapsales cyanobacterium LEGE 10410]
MNHIYSVNTETFLSDTLSNVLSQLSHFQEHSCLQVVHNSTIFFIHFNEGKLIYATNSLAPFERLERHLRRLGNQNSQLDSSIIKQPRLKFENGLESYIQLPSDYQGIIWLSEQGYLDPQEAVTLLRRITREVFESFLCLSDAFQFKFVPKTEQMTELCRFDFKAYVGQCQKRLEAWQAFSEKIWSSYQRPYLVTEKTQAIRNFTAEQNRTICKLLKGLNFRQISAILDRDELIIAKILYPSILDNTIVVRDPKPPFDRLPKLVLTENIFDLTLQTSELDWRGEDSGFQFNFHSQETAHSLESTWKVACVDNNPLTHLNLTSYLQQDLFITLTIQDALDAFAKLIEFQPHIILLGTNMANLDGSELCTLLRNHNDFKVVPIVMLDEVSQSVSQNKLKRMGATDSLTKPLKRTELLDMIWKYLP